MAGLRQGCARSRPRDESPVLTFTYLEFVRVDRHVANVAHFESLPKLVLLDSALPGADGIEMMRGLLGATNVTLIILSAYGKGGVVDYISRYHGLQDPEMTLPEEFTVPQAASYLNVSEETVRRNIRAKRLSALRRGTQWFIRCDVLALFSKCYDPKTGKIRQSDNS